MSPNVIRLDLWVLPMPPAGPCANSTLPWLVTQRLPPRKSREEDRKGSIHPYIRDVRELSPQPPDSMHPRTRQPSKTCSIARRLVAILPVKAFGRMSHYHATAFKMEPAAAATLCRCIKIRTVRPALAPHRARSGVRLAAATTRPSALPETELGSFLLVPNLLRGH